MADELDQQAQAELDGAEAQRHEEERLGVAAEGEERGRGWQVQQLVEPKAEDVAGESADEDGAHPQDHQPFDD